MAYQAVNSQLDALSKTLRILLLGMAIALLVSIVISINSWETNSTISVDCDNPQSLAQAQDRSRNGIATECL